MNQKELLEQYRFDALPFLRVRTDFPTNGVKFLDITPLVTIPRLLNATLCHLQLLANTDANYIASPEARGFYFGPALAASLGAGFIPFRKPGKLPYFSHSTVAHKEYGSDILQSDLRSATPVASKQFPLDEVQGNPLPTYQQLQAFNKSYSSIIGHDLRSPHWQSTSNKVIIVDDVLATGQTLYSLINLLNTSGYEVLQVLTVVELQGITFNHNGKTLTGSELLSTTGVPYQSLISVSPDFDFAECRAQFEDNLLKWYSELGINYGNRDSQVTYRKSTIKEDFKSPKDLLSKRAHQLNSDVVDTSAKPLNLGIPGLGGKIVD